MGPTYAQAHTAYAQAHTRGLLFTLKHMTEAIFGSFFTLKHIRLTLKHMPYRVLERK